MSLFNLSINGLEALQAKVQSRSAAAKDLTRPLERAAIMTHDTAVMRIHAGGIPAWIPSRRAISTGGTTGIRTGAMMGGILPGPVRISNGSGSVEVGVSGPSANYAKIFQRGSGSRGGGSDWTTTIRAKNAKALSWLGNGGTRYFARSVTITHHGQPPRPFLYFDDPLKARIVELFRQYIGSGS